MKSLRRQTKVIATVGPASESEDVLKALILEGVDVFRFNMAHADHEWVREISSRIRSVGVDLNREPAIMMDIKGPEIRTGFLSKPISLAEGQLIEAGRHYEAYASQESGSIRQGMAQMEAARVYGLAGELQKQRALLKSVRDNFSQYPIAAQARLAMDML